MVHASTKATLKFEFGGSKYITEEIHATKYPEATLNGYKKAKKLEAAPAPLTNFEEEKKLINAAEVQEACVSALSQTLKGVCFPLTDEAKTAVEEMVKEQHNYLQFEIIIKDEQISLTKSETISNDQLRRQILRDHPRYHVFSFKHIHDGITQKPYVFIYSMPDYARVSVKERMLYSSCKAPFVEFLTSNGIQIAKKMEIGSGNEVTEEALTEEFHPKIVERSQPKAKPKLPPGLGMMPFKLPGMEPK